MITAFLLAVATNGFAPAHKATLSCGNGQFSVVSRRWARPSPLAPATQSMTVKVAGKNRAAPLQPTRLVSVEGHRVRNHYLLGWTCVTATTGASYALLGYACAVDPGYPNDCGGEKEWYRLMDDRGRPVDIGVPVNGVARERLVQRLGILKQMEAGVHMNDVLE